MISLCNKSDIFQKGNANSDDIVPFLNSRLSLRVDKSNITSYETDGRFTLIMRGIK